MLFTTILQRYRKLYIVLAPGRDSLLSSCHNPDSLLDEPEIKFLKQDHATSVAHRMIAGNDLVIKQYHLRNVGYALKRSVRRSRAQHCWDMAKILQQVDISTASTAGFIEEHLGPFRRRSWLLLDWLEGVVCSDYLQDHGLNDTTRPVCFALLELLQQLGEQRIAHGDLKASNILLTATGPALIDLDGAHSYRSGSLFWRHARRRDLRRFLRNWTQQPELLEFFTQHLKE